ncbi:MAG: enoyl-CoA hydratase-related protein [Acidimicrobiales bacterium]
MEPVGLSIADGVATITLQTPENRNALSVRLRSGLLAALDAAMQETSARAVVLTGAGPIFCSGADLREAAAGVQDGPSLPGILERITDAPKPVVAVLNGSARAGGIGLVAACDLAVAPDTATFAFSEVRIGVIPAIISIPCLQRLSSRAAARYFLTGETFDAPTAVECGLLTAAVAPDDVAGLASALTTALRKGAPRALAGTKRLLSEIPGMPRDVAFAYAERISAVYFASDDAVEGRSAFVEKRQPVWDDT